jgi:tryptophan halogenase
VIDSEVDSVAVDNGLVTGVTLANGESVAADYWIDASGFARVLSQPLGTGWHSYAQDLTCDRAMPFIIDHQGPIQPLTESHALSAGWMWQIPLQHRWGCGYTFNSEFITVEEAKKEVEDYIGKEITIQKVFDFKPGTHKRSWIGNSVAIGLSYGFIEPLEATSLMSTIMQLMRIISAKFDVSLRDRFNDTCSSINEQNMMFVRYHYLAERFDTPFWKASYEMPIPEKLQLILDTDNNIIPKTNAELLKIFDLKEVDEMELTFFTYNYQMIFKKNKKVSIKELI